ncbi:NADP-dependent oxidoreductase [Kitasatospora sp. NPDC101235]|uniref:NADP-dependent oxidoreductase n=1 Tax=Kitasatospora sp. NPDC101235 TaxID=3364101 RepID=UPI00381372BF
MDDAGNPARPSVCKSPEQGAATSVLLAALPLVDGVTGRYFEGNQEAPVVRSNEGRPSGVAVHALDHGAADRPWEYAAAALRTA